MFFKNKYLTNNPAFGEMKYIISGWEKTLQIDFNFLGDKRKVKVWAVASSRKEMVTKQQEMAYISFLENVEDKEKIVEDVLKREFPELTEDELKKRFSFSRICFCRNGDCGICIDDEEAEIWDIDPTSGFAIQFTPEVKFFDTEDEYIAWNLY